MTDDLPSYIAIASSKNTVVLIEHADTFEEAEAWCLRAMPRLAGKVEQLAVARVHLVHRLHFGEAPAFAPACGWHWIDGAWREVQTSQLNLTFSEFFPSHPEEPSVMSQTPPQHSYLECAAHVADVAVALSGLAQALHQFRRLMVTDKDRLRVLVVDDSPHVRGTLRRALQQEHDVVEAASYADALVLLATSAFDAVVADDEMGSIGSGPSLLAEVRDRWPLIRRVLCAVSVSEIAERIEPGVAHRVLESPVDRLLLLASLR